MDKAMSRRKLLAASSMAGFVLFPGRTAHAAGADVEGQWHTLSYRMPINPIHVALLRTGKVLVVAGSENDPASQRNRAAILELAKQNVAEEEIAWDLFCNGTSFLPDGRVLIVGGTGEYDPFTGTAYAVYYDPTTGAFTEGPEMHEGRWYPTSTALSDGTIVVISGQTRTSSVSRTLEIFTPTGGGSWASYPTPFTPRLYPWGFLLPNGRVLYVGPAPTTREFNPARVGFSDAWRTIATTHYSGNRSAGAAVLLPLTPPYTAPRLLIIGGGGSPATPTAEVIEPLGAARWTQAAPMRYRRRFHNATLLPTGQVLVTGGLEGSAPSPAVRRAEWYHPVTNRWTSGAAARYTREYHSVALLLPDATVLTAGSNPKRGTYTKEMEIFSPPYLFTTNSAGAVVRAARPTINTLPSSVRYDSSFTISTPASRSITSVVLMRPAAVTHGVDMEQRAVSLAFTRPSSTTLRVTAPPNGAIAPPGYSMLFLVNASNVPSTAKRLRLHN